MLSQFPGMVPNQYAGPGAAQATNTGMQFANGAPQAATMSSGAMYAYSMQNGGGGGALPHGPAVPRGQFTPFTGAGGGSGGPMDRLSRGDVSPTAMRKLSHNAVEVRRSTRRACGAEG